MPARKKARGRAVQRTTNSVSVKAAAVLEKVAQEHYEVEVILKARLTGRGKWEFLVRWAGYEPEDDSWVPKKSLINCERLIGSFWLEIGRDENTFSRGEEAVPSQEWIEDEQRYFRRTFANRASTPQS